MSRRQESGLAKRYDGTVTPGSGNGWVKKNDVRTDTLSIEAKYTDKKQFTLKQADLHTAETHALLDGRDSVFMVSFSGEEWAILREDDYRCLWWDSKRLDGLLQERRTSVPSAPQSPDNGWEQPMLPGAATWS